MGTTGAIGNGPCYYPTVADDTIRVPEHSAAANAVAVAFGWDSDFARERFLMRARALFFARVALLTMGLGILLVPPWKALFQVDSILPIALYMGMVAYSAANYVLLDRVKVGKVVTFVTLCQDLTALVYLIAVSGGMHSPLLPTQLLFTMMFVMLFPRPWAVVPPLLTFPIVAYIQQEREVGSFGAGDLFLLLWYCVINCIVLSLVLYLHTREEMKHREILRLQASLGEMAVIDERTRLAREIHDGLGGTLSSLILQVEYIQGMSMDEPLRRELGELKTQAEESIDELRRALTLMRDDFHCPRRRGRLPQVRDARARTEGGFRAVGPRTARHFRGCADPLPRVAGEPHKHRASCQGHARNGVSAVRGGWLHAVGRGQRQGLRRKSAAAGRTLRAAQHGGTGAARTWPRPHRKHNRTRDHHIFDGAQRSGGRRILTGSGASCLTGGRTCLEFAS